MQSYPISLSRSKSTVYSGSLDFTIIQGVLGVTAEVAENTSSTTTVTENVSVPGYNTYYAAFGSVYVDAKVQYNTINSDCTRTWSGTIYSNTYTYDDYLGTYQVNLQKGTKYSLSYLDSLNLR